MIDKILNYKTVTTKEKIDRLLEIDATQYCNLGCDSTKAEVQEAKKQSRAIYRAIAKDRDWETNRKNNIRRGVREYLEELRND